MGGEKRIASREMTIPLDTKALVRECWSGEWPPSSTFRSFLALIRLPQTALEELCAEIFGGTAHWSLSISTSATRLKNAKIIRGKLVI